MIPYLFLVILLLLTVVIFIICKNRNAWDALFFNSTLAIIALFMAGILANNLEIWKLIVIAFGIIATGEKIVQLFIDKNDPKI